MANISLTIGGATRTRAIPNADAVRMLNQLCVHRGIPVTEIALATYEIDKLLASLIDETRNRERQATVIAPIPIT